jgi:hypothetical protein
VLPSAGKVDGKPYNATVAGIGPTVVIEDSTVANPLAEAAMVVVPGLNVDWKSVEAYVEPLCTVTNGCTVPMLVREDDKPTVVSCTARVGSPLESRSWTKMQLYELLSAGTLVGPM